MGLPELIHKSSMTFLSLTHWMSVFMIRKSLWHRIYFITERERVPAQKLDGLTSPLPPFAVMRAVLTDLLCCLTDKMTVCFITVAHAYQPTLQFDDYHGKIYIYIYIYIYVNIYIYLHIYVADLLRDYNYSSFRSHKFYNGWVLQTRNQFIGLSHKRKSNLPLLEE